MAGVAHETLLSHSERPTLLILFAAMMGLPAFLTSTEIFPHEKKDPSKKEESRMKRIEQHAEKDVEDRTKLLEELAQRHDPPHTKDQGHGKE